MKWKIQRQIIIMSKFAAIGLFMQCLLAGMLLANSSIGQQKSLKEIYVKVNWENVKVKEAFSSLNAKAGFSFTYFETGLEAEKSISLKSRKISMEKILMKISAETDLQFKRINSKIYVKKKDTGLDTGIEEIIELQQFSVSGQITSTEDNEFLPGVSVLIKGSNMGTTSDINGEYSLQVTEGDVLQFSYIGFTTQEIVVGNQTIINVALDVDLEQLEEVVVVGYGTQKKSHVTGSIATMDSKAMTVVPTTNTSAALAGRLPGLIVTNNSGEPGNDVADIAIRGFGRALVIVDGVPRDFQQLDPNEIESITILKDASAAIYGAQAGNGVVLVTTKRGRRDTPPQVNYNGIFSLQSPTYLPPIASPHGVASFFNSMQKAEGIPDNELRYTDEEVELFRQGTQQGYRGTDWHDVLLKNNAPSYQHNINASGGNKNMNYFINIGRLDQNSLLESGAGKFERWNFGATVDANITDNLKVGMDLKYRIEDRDNPTGGEGRDGYESFFRFLLYGDPTIEQNPDGLLTATGVNSLQQNPIAYGDQDISGFENDNRKQFNLIFNADYSLPIDGLSAKARVAYQSWNRSNRSALFPWDQYKYDWDLQESQLIDGSRDNEVSTYTIETNNLTTQFSLNYAKKFGDHEISGLFLGENRYFDRYRVDTRTTNLLTTSIPYVFNASGSAVTNDEPSESGRKSWLGRVNYSYKDRYLLEGLYRADAAIEFPPESRWGHFFGLSGGWVMSREAFFDGVDFLSFLKLRASYGQLGDDRTVGGGGTSRFDYLTGFALTNEARWILGNDVYSSSLTTLGLPNPNITWTTMKTTNVGFEAILFNDILGIEFDYFFRLQDGLLAQRDQELPSTFGGVLPRENIEQRNNRGFELVLNHDNNIGDLKFSISGNVTWTREKWVSFPDGQFDPENPDDERINKRTGQWTNRIFGYKTNGFYNTQDELDAEELVYEFIPDPVLGDVRYVDSNGDGVINTNDRVVIGRGVANNGLPPIPEFMYGLTTNVSYKGFDFFMLWQGAANIDYLATGLEREANMNISQMPFQYIVDNSWTPETASSATLPIHTTDGLGTHNNQALDIFVRNGNYIRLKSITLGYSIPNTLLDKVSIRKARVYVAGYNLLTFTKNDLFAFDPESRAGNSFAVYPVMKTVSFGVNLGF